MLDFRLAYDEAVRALRAQADEHSSLRTRAGTILATSLVVTSFFGGQAVARNAPASSLGWLAVVAFLLCNFLPSQVLQAIANAVMRTAPAAGIALTVLAVILPLILAPVIAAVITLMYYDLRVRREAFDLQVLGQRLGII